MNITKQLLLEQVENGYIISIPGMPGQRRLWIFEQLSEALIAVTTAFDVLSRHEGMDYDEGEVMVNPWDVVEQALKEIPRGLS